MSKQRSSMRDVARAANVSVSAVSLVVRGKPGVSSETRERIRTAMSELDYEAPGVPFDGGFGAIGLLIERNSVPVVMDVFYGDVIRGFQAEAQRLGYQVTLHMYDSAKDTLEWLRTSPPGAVQGVIVANDGDIDPETIGKMQALNLPLVLVENYSPDRRIQCVLGDNVTAGYTAMRHLLELGHRSVAILRGPSKYSSLVHRLRGCLAAAAEEGVLIPTEFLPQPVSGHPQKGYVQMCEILRLEERPTAVVAISDKTALGAMEAIREAGLRIPEDIAIVSIDYVVESAYTRPPLTTVRIPRHEIGALTMQKLHRLISGEREVPAKSVVYSQLVVRESCGTHLRHR